MNKIIPSVIQDNGEYYIHMEEYKKVKELGEHYKHLYSEVKKQKDDVVEFIKKHFQDDEGIICKYVGDNACEINEKFIDELLRMLGEIK